MAYSNQTAHYGLPLPTGADKSTWLDANDGFQAVDTALYGAVTALSEDQLIVSQLAVDVANLSASLLDVKGDVGGLQNGLASTNLLVQANAEQITQVKSRLAQMDADHTPVAITVDTSTATQGAAPSVSQLLVDAFLIHISASGSVPSAGITYESVATGVYGIVLGDVSASDVTTYFPELVNEGDAIGLGRTAANRNVGFATAVSSTPFVGSSISLVKRANGKGALLLMSASSAVTMYGTNGTSAADCSLYASNTIMRSAVAHEPVE